MASVHALQKKIGSLQQSTKRAREKAGEIVESFVTATEVAGTAFGLGIWEGRTTDPKQFEVMGVPVPLGLALGAHLFALFGVGRGMDSHLRNIGNGALASHVNGLGRKLGSDMAKKSVSGEPSLLGAASGRRGVSITQDDLSTLARA